MDLYSGVVEEEDEATDGHVFSLVGFYGSWLFLVGDGQVHG